MSKNFHFFELCLFDGVNENGFVQVSVLVHVRFWS